MFTRVLRILETHPTLVVLALTAFGALLRLQALGEKSLWMDEAVCYWASQPDWLAIVDYNRSVRATPPLFTWIVHAVSLGSQAEAWLRSPAWLAGVASVPATYYLGRAVASARAALFPAALVAVAAWQIRFSQLVSEYTLAFLLSTLCMGLFLRFVRDPRPLRGALLSGLLLLGGGTHYGIAMLDLVFNGIVLFALWRSTAPRRLLLGWIGVQLPILIAAVATFFAFNLSWILHQGPPGRDGYLARAYWDPGSIGSLARLVGPNTLDIFDFAAVQGGILLLLCGLGLAALWDERNRVVALLLPASLGVGLLGALAGLYPYDGTRHVFYLLPAIYATAACGLAAIARFTPERPARILCALLLATVLGTDLRESLWHLRSDGWQMMRPVAETLEHERQEGDAVFVYSKSLPAYLYYAVREDPERHAELSRNLDWLIDAESTFEEDEERLDHMLDGPERVWILLSHCEPRCADLLDRAALRRKLDRVAAASGVSLHLAERRTPPGAADSSRPAAEADGGAP